MNEGSPKVRKTGSPKVIKRPEVRSLKSEEEENSPIDIPSLPTGTAQSTTKQLPTENSKLETEEMEVHHHPDLHHEKKAWKEYFLEGLMIFLAVTMGFFAETMRENISESSQAKELAKSLYQEVYGDSINMQYRVGLREKKEQQGDYFRKYIRDSSLVNLSDKFYPSFFWTFAVSSIIQFTPNDGLLNQLHNSGSLRYFKGIALQNSISNMNVVILNLRNRNAEENAFMLNFCRPFMQKYYDFDWEDDLTDHGKISGFASILKSPTFHTVKPLRIRNLKDFNRDDAEALATQYILMIRITKLIDYNPYIKANHELLKELRKAYNFKDE